MTRAWVRRAPLRMVEIVCAICGREATMPWKNGWRPRYCEDCRRLDGDVNIAYVDFLSRQRAQGRETNIGRAADEWRRRRRASRGQCRGCGVTLPDPGRGAGPRVWCSESCRGRFRRRHGGSTRPTVTDRGVCVMP
ncbi:MAG: hypothetical protein ACREN2_02185 [Candidatus Dormibacteria bacterium]